MHPYQDSSETLQTRVDDLLSRMTPVEKVGQLLMLDGRCNLDEVIPSRTPGSFLHILGDDCNRAIDLATQTRLGIPLLIAEDCIHGHTFWVGATVFPTQLALSCSWNPDLLEEVAHITAREARPTGVHWTFSPVLCITRDLRWGRVGETFGEDPFLIGELGAAMIRGYQGKSLDDPEGILATAKHYAGYSETQGGRDASEADLSPRKLRSYFFPPFEKAARSGCMTFMTGYQSIEGVPSTASQWLLSDVLKDEWGYEGIVVTDWDNVGRMFWEQRTCATIKEAAALAVKCGNDLMMATPTFFEGALEALAEGLLTEEEIDVPCRRVLELKFRMGLFEDPRRADLDAATQIMALPQHQKVNLEAARQSLVLLKNDGVLPLQEDGLHRIAVIGPNANDPQEQLGDWSLGSGQSEETKGGQPRETITTVFEGLVARAPENCEVVYAEGCKVMSDDTSGIEAAVEAARSADVIVVRVGDAIPLIGEGCSTATLELQGGQLPLLEALSELGKPMVVVLINSKPLVLPSSVQSATAIIEAFNPGMRGGTAIAELIFGDLNTSGKLTTSFPYHVGQQPIYYSQVRGQHGDKYADLTQEPLFAFGFGLSYTTYKYSDLRILTPELKRGEAAQVEVTVTNTGERDGEEIVQLYVEDEVTSVTWVQKELKAFRKIALKTGQSETVRFKLPFEALSIVNARGERVVEPGRFKIHVGSSSRVVDLLHDVLTVVD